MSVAYAHALVSSPGDMVYWLAEACRGAREEAGRQPVHVAAAASMNQTSITRFENHETAFAGLERIVQAYADDLDVDARELWRRALEQWEKAGR